MNYNSLDDAVQSTAREEELRKELVRVEQTLRKQIWVLEKKKRKYTRYLVIACIPYVILFFPIILPLYVLSRIRKKYGILGITALESSDSRRTFLTRKKYVERTIFKMQSLGLTNTAYEELESIYNNDPGNVYYDDPDTRIRAMAGHGLACHLMRKRDTDSYKKALQILGVVKKANHVSNTFDSEILVLRIICLSNLNRTSELWWLKLQSKFRPSFYPNVLLALTNSENEYQAKLKWINRVNKKFDIPPVKLNGDGDAVSLYDQLTTADTLKKIADGPKVSVLIASYNADTTLATAIRSLQEQTWENLEIIVIDDASPTSDTADIVNSLSKNDKRIRFLRLDQNGGAYVARNAGLDIATGEYVTLHDADDWSHPTKIEIQVQHLINDPGQIGCTSQQARMDTDLSLTRWTGKGRYLISNISSFMFRRKEIISELGGWDTVRYGADKELMRRAETRFGKEKVKQLATGPLSLQRSWAGSAVANNLVGINGFAYGARKEYHEAYGDHHASGGNIRYSRDSALREFAVAEVMKPDRHHKTVRHFDVIYASDLRMKGGSTHSCQQEVRAAKRAGLHVGVFQMFRYDLNVDYGMIPSMRSEIDGKNVEILSYGDKVTCDLLVLRYPPILNHEHKYLPSIQARSVKMVINQPPVSDYSSKGIDRYSLEKCSANAKNAFGLDPLWHANGPMVKKALMERHPEELDHIDFSENIWGNIIDFDNWRRENYVPDPAKKMRLGRHSRDSYVKWPEAKEDILACYPENDECEIHVLGGSKTVEGIVGHRPRNWVVHEFGSMEPKDFLKSIDVFSFFAHSDWVESFPRTVLEAMAVGVPVILPDKHKDLFGDAAVYADENSAYNSALELFNDVDKYVAQVQRAWTFLDTKCSYPAYIERLYQAGVKEAKE